MDDATRVEYEQHRRNQQLEQEGEQFAAVFSTFCNDSRKDIHHHAVRRMVREHRTIQQNMMRFCMMFIEEMSKNNSDMRNEASVNLAKQIMELDSRDRALPYI